MIYTSKFLAIEKSRYVLCSSLIGVITQVIGVVILGPFFGIIGIAISFLISSVTSSMFLVTINKFSR